MKYPLLLLPLVFLAGCGTTDFDSPVELGNSSVKSATVSSSGINGIYTGGDSYDPSTHQYISAGKKLVNPSHIATLSDHYSDAEYGKNVIAGPQSVSKDRIVYFNYDSYRIDPRAKAVLHEHAHYLKRHPDFNIQLEGHTDTQGSREYNLALGEARAKSVKQYFQRLGVSPSRMRVVSFGEEKPAVRAYDNRAHQRNRRVIIQY